MTGRDIKIGAGIFHAEIVRHAEGVAPGCVGFFREKIDGRQCLLIVANRADGFRVLILDDDGRITDIR